MVALQAHNLPTLIIVEVRFIGVLATVEPRSIKVVKNPLSGVLQLLLLDLLAYLPHPPICDIQAWGDIP